MTRTSAYVVVSSPTDAHIPFVEKHLDQPFVVLDWTQIPAGTPASYILGKQGFGLEWDGRRLDRVASVWFRKPYKIEAKNLPIAPELAAYAAGSLQQFNDLLLAHFDSALWISDYYAMRRALNKTLQLTVAQRLGFAVPDTLITASPRAAQAFVERQRATIVKP